jgi:hypothetical protein
MDNTQSLKGMEFKTLGVFCTAAGVFADPGGEEGPPSICKECAPDDDGRRRVRLLPGRPDGLQSLHQHATGADHHPL